MIKQKTENPYAFKISFLKTECIYFIVDLNTADIAGYPDKRWLSIQEACSLGTAIASLRRS